MNMRLVSYNILNGGEGRADPLAEVILAQRPDVVVLIEADVPMVIDRISKRLGMQPYLGVGSKHTVAVFSRWPVLESIDHSAIDGELSRGMLEVVVRTPGDFELPIIALHLPAKATLADEAKRLRIWERVLKRLPSQRAEHRPHLLCGDFNANAPTQKIVPEKCKQATREAWIANGGKLPRELIAAVEVAGYVDTLHTFDGPSADVTGSFDTQTPGQRVDYIFAFGLPNDSVRSAWIEQDRLAKYASDHFPIGVDITLPAAAKVGS